MKKTFSITIAGQVFHIEEDGYERLRGYLASVQQYFSTYEGSSEIIADIEGRIAEKFSDRLQKEEIQALNAQHIDDLIRSMGTVSDFEALEEEEDLQTLAANRANANGGNTTAPRRPCWGRIRQCAGCTGIPSANCSGVWPPAWRITSTPIRSGCGLFFCFCSSAFRRAMVFFTATTATSPGRSAGLSS